MRGLSGQGTRKLTLKDDPRDLSRIFGLTEDGIIEARAADPTRPAVTLGGSTARPGLREAGRRSVDEGLIFSPNEGATRTLGHAVRQTKARRARVDIAVRQTKAMRRHQARRADLEPGPMIGVTPVVAVQMVSRP